MLDLALKYSPQLHGTSRNNPPLQQIQLLPHDRGQHHPTSFSQDHTSRRNIPDVHPALPVPIRRAARYSADVQRSAALHAQPVTRVRFRAHCCHVLCFDSHGFTVSSSSHLTDQQGLIKFSLPGYPQWEPVQLCTESQPTREQLVQHWVVDYTELDGLENGETDNDAGVRVTVHKVHCAVYWVHYPGGSVSEYYLTWQCKLVQFINSIITFK